jgi:hypothetical protein
MMDRKIVGSLVAVNFDKSRENLERILMECIQGYSGGRRKRGQNKKVTG